MTYSMLTLALLCLVTNIPLIQTACSLISGCDSCFNPGLQCYSCPDAKVLNSDNTGCLSCPNYCQNCTADENDFTKCTNCTTGYFLEPDGTCTGCGKGCTKCHKDKENKIICDSCDQHFIQDKKHPHKQCVECPDNCRQCKLKENGGTECKSCYNKQEHGKRSYFLLNKEKLCRACPNNCDTCVDNGHGKAQCTACISGYIPISTPSDSQVHGSKCLVCPKDCDSCYGQEMSPGIAVCKTCVKGKGLWLDRGECVYCDKDKCADCDSTTGSCTTCRAGYRLMEGVGCTACPFFCLDCPAEDPVADDEVQCKLCQTGYGHKIRQSVTCDVCPEGCAECSQDNKGVVTCQQCQANHAMKPDGQCHECALGCADCSWDNIQSFMRCVSCKADYSNTPLTMNDNAESATNIAYCQKCPAKCSKCENGTSCNPTSTDCHDGHVVVLEDDVYKCKEITANCHTAADDLTTDCALCKDGYYVDAGKCKPCTSKLNCATCHNGLAEACDTCPLTYTLVDTDADNVTDTCELCKITACERCTDIDDVAGGLKSCDQCQLGYVLYDSNTDDDIAYDKCKACPPGCDDCTYDASTDRTVCTNAGCAPWDDRKQAYAFMPNGTCIACPANCEVCTFDELHGTAACIVSGCTSGFTRDEDYLDCSICPKHCTQCEWDANSRTALCSADSCQEFYTLTPDGTCEPCPYQCSSCSYDSTIKRPVCDTCTANHRLNDGVCGTCPPDCDECFEKDSRMVCQTCRAGYTLRMPDGACVRCPSKCETCTASGKTVLCDTCQYGYGASADQKSCVECSTAAFSHCESCSNVNSFTKVATCNNCSAPYILADDSSSCLDSSHLDCPGGAADKPAVCTSCSGPYDPISGQAVCSQFCYVCGDVKTGVFVDKNQCKTDNASAKLERCDLDVGTCFAKIKTVGGKQLVSAGCMRTEDEACIGDTALGEVCLNTGDVQVCSRCCGGNKCNDFVSTLDGISDEASIFTSNVVFVIFSVVNVILLI